MTEERVKIQRTIENCEKSGSFDTHVVPPDFSLSLPVDGDFSYLRRGPIHFVKRFFADTVTFFCEKKINVGLFDTKIVGAENMEGISNSVVVCNHVHRFDCVIVRKAFKRKHLYIAAAEFNNRKDFLGFLMRYSGMLPLSSKLSAMRNFENAVTKILHGKNGHLLIYPEASEWLYYKKPRPIKSGAFHFAVKNDVPVLPMFITFDNEQRTDKAGDPMPAATLHILKPIYADKTLDRHAVLEKMKDDVYDAWKKVYEESYGQPLEYEGLKA